MKLPFYEIALLFLSVGIALVLTGFGALRLLFNVEIGSIVVRAFVILIGLLLTSAGLTVMLKSPS